MVADRWNDSSSCDAKSERADYQAINTLHNYSNPSSVGFTVFEV
jgi:hypothetical protein